MNQPNLRYPKLPIIFGDESTAQKYIEELQAAAKAQRVPMAVSPRCQLTLPDGKTVLKAGDEVTLKMYASDPEALRRELRCARVLEWDSPPPEAA